MPDCHQSTDPYPPNPSPRRRRSSDSGSRDRHQRSTTADSARPRAPRGGEKTQAAIQEELREIGEAIRQIDEQLATIGIELPESIGPFDSSAELRAGIECVQTDLLADAIETLLVLATATESQLRESFEERQKWAAV